MMCIKITLCGLLLQFLIIPVTPIEDYVYKYDYSNFKQQIASMDGSFIMFYAPWCKHCTNFESTWNDLAELVNTPESNFAIAKVDCTENQKLCNDNDVTGYPTLLYFAKNSMEYIEYKSTRDMPALTQFLSEVFSLNKDSTTKTEQGDVTIHGGMAYLNDQNCEKYLSNGQHFILFYAPWCSASQSLAPVWAELAVHYSSNDYFKIGKINCMQSPITCENFDIKEYPHLVWIVNGRIMGVSHDRSIANLKYYVEKMVQSENHDPELFKKKEKVFPVARITEETFDSFIETDLLFVHYYASWCSHCMRLNQVWVELGKVFQNDSRVLIADVDCTKSKTLCDTEKVTGLPTLILYKNKKVVEQESGAQTLSALQSLVSKYIDVTKEADTDPVVKDEL